jgi:hypothetical protein
MAHERSGGEYMETAKSSLWVTIQVAADALGVSTDHLYKSVRRGRCTIRVQRVGNLLRFSGHDLGLFEDGTEALPINGMAESLETSPKVSPSNSALDHNQVSSSLTDGADLSNKKER